MNKNDVQSTKQKRIKKSPIKKQDLVIENEPKYGILNENDEIFGYIRIDHNTPILEYEIPCKYVSKNILKSLSLKENNNSLYMFLELQSLTFNTIMNSIQISFEEKLTYFCEICKIIKILHDNNIIHGCLNPNVFNLNSNKDFSLVDFLSCRKDSPSTKNYPHLNMLSYTSPNLLEKIIQNDFSVSKKDDIWSLGMILLNIIKKQPEFNTEKDQLNYYYQFVKDDRNILFFNKQLDRTIPSKYKEHILSLFSSILEYDEEKRFNIDQIIEHELIKCKEEPVEIKIIKNGDNKFNVNFRDELKNLINFFIKSFPEERAEILFLASDLYYRSYSLLDSKSNIEVHELGFICSYISLKYFNYEIEIENLIKHEYSNIKKENIIEIYPKIILVLQGVIYQSSLYDKCIYEIDLLNSIDMIIMDKSFQYFKYKFSLVEKERGENLKPKENVTIKDVFN